MFIHSAGQALEPGVSVRAIDLASILARLGYTETKAAPSAPGQYRRAGGIWDIYLREESARIGLEVRGDRIARVTRDGKETQGAALEGEVLTGGADQPGEDYRPIKLAETSKVLIDAVIAIEDHRFFDHGALDLRSLARAVWVNARAGKVTEGGSTITQQLIKNRLLTPDRTMARKLREVWLATLVEWRYSKSQILEAYLNEIYLGQRGSLAIRGVGAASRAYFAKEAHQLTPGEAALLAGMVRAPNTYSPVLNPERARQRRDVVLGRMRELKTLDAAAYERARKEPVRALARPRPGQPAPYFTDHARQEVEERFGAGTRIVTTIDLTLQRFAENAVAGGLDQLESRYAKLRRSDPRDRLQAALIALDPATGEIRAYVGGRDYQASQFDRVTLARRQPGSAFKPFVYLAAIRPREGALPFTAATMVEDTPITVERERQAVEPAQLRRSLRGTRERAPGARAVAERGHRAHRPGRRRTGHRGDRQGPRPLSEGGADPLARPRHARGDADRPRDSVCPVPVAACVRSRSAGARGLPAANSSPLRMHDDAAPSPSSCPPAYPMTWLLQGVIRSNGSAARSLRGWRRGLARGGTKPIGSTTHRSSATSSRLVVTVWVRLLRRCAPRPERRHSRAPDLNGSS